MPVARITETRSGNDHVSSRVVGVLNLVPSDYDIVSTTSGGSNEVEGLANASDERSQYTYEQVPGNPPSWPTEHRRVSPYRPINRHLDTSIRPSGHNAALFVFITTMLGGCHILAVCSIAYPCGIVINNSRKLIEHGAG
jgi:hypothetical protein